jgi:Zn-dependent alcohol dehydrogenase
MPAGSASSAARLLNTGAFDPEPFVTRSVGLEGVGQAFYDLLSGSPDRKVLVEPGL